MRPTQAALILGLLAALGLLIWFAAGYGEGAPKVAGPAPLGLLQKEPTTQSERAGPPSAAPLPELGSERSALATEGGVGVPEVLAAGGSARRIRGRIVDALGAPVAGARVVAAGARGMALVALDQLAPEELPWVKRETATSGADGVFELASIPGDTLRLAVRAPGCAPLRTERPLSGPARDDLGELVLERGVVLAGRVVDAAGQAVADAELHSLPPDAPGIVFVAHGSRGTFLGSTDRAGRFELDQIAAGPYRLAVRHADHPEAVEEGQTDAPGEVRSGLLIRLEEGFTITGRVSGLTVGSAGDYRVRARPVESEDAQYALREAALAPDGAFQLRGVRGGREYLLKLVEADAGPFGSDRSAAVLARPGETDVRLELVEGLAIVGRVVDASTQAPIERFVVEAGTAWMSPQTDAAGEAVEEHAGGAFRYEGVDPLADRQPLSVRVRAEGYATFVQKDVPIPSARVIDLGLIRLEPVPFLTVHVLDALDLSPVPGARVLLAPTPWGDTLDPAAFALPDEGEALQASADAHGTARVQSLPGRRCTLRVTHSDFAPFHSDPIELPVSGDAEHRVLLTKGGTVEVLVVDRAGTPAPGVSVTRRGRGAQALPALAPSFETDASGVVRFEHLDVGLHAFRLVDPGGRGALGSAEFYFALDEREPDEVDDGQVDVLVAEGSYERITLELPARGSLRGRVTEAGKPLPGATLLLEAPEARGSGLLGLVAGPRATSDGRGAFRFEDVRVGEQTLRVVHASRAMDAELAVRLIEGDNELEVTLDLAVIEGRVTDEEGQPVAGASVRVSRAAGAAPGAPRIAVDGQQVSFRPAGGSEATADAAGHFQLRGVVTGALLVVEARAGGCQPRRSEPLELRPGETRGGVELQLAFGGRVEVDAFDRDGSPASFVLVSGEYAGADGAGVEPAREFVQEGGRATFQGLFPGPWRFTARSVAFGGDGSAELRAEPVQVIVVSRETRSVRLDLR